MVSNFLKCEMLLSFPGKGFHYATRDAWPRKIPKALPLGFSRALSDMDFEHASTRAVVVVSIYIPTVSISLRSGRGRRNKVIASAPATIIQS